MGQYIYINESTSYWDPDKQQPANTKVRIGREDPDTGEKFYKLWYIERLKRQGEATDGMKVWGDRRERRTKTAQPDKPPGYDETKLAQEILDTVKDYGTAYFLQRIAEGIGLVAVMEGAMPQCWRKLFVLACYLVASDKPVDYCSDWVEDNEGMDAGNMSSQRISELLSQISYNDRTAFYKKWYSHILENDYLALDITSVSSYSGNIEDLEWGYNRDGESLPQLNICMLFGEKSRLPVYQTVYSGSLGDVTTLKSTLSEFTALTGSKDFGLVMDKGFFSNKNVDTMLAGDGGQPYRFLIPVSFTSRFAKNRIASEKAAIDGIENLVLTSGDPIRGVHRLLPWGKSGARLHTHVYFNPIKAAKDRNDLYEYVVRLKQKALSNPSDKKSQKGFKRYLAIGAPGPTGKGAAVSVRKDVIERELSRAGWFVLISNYIEETQTAYDIYRAKDVVEKSFFQYKNNLGINRLRVHSDERMLNKTFAAFIALILACHIHNVMKVKELDAIMSFGKLLAALSKLKSAFVNGRLVLRPLTKEQKLIFDSFNIPLPE